MSFQAFLAVNIGLLWVAVAMTYLLIKRVIERSNLEAGPMLVSEVVGALPSPLQSTYQPGSKLPEFEVPTSDGHVISNRASTTTCFLFVSQHCDSCKDILSDDLERIRGQALGRGMGLVVADVTPRASTRRSRRFFEQHLRPDHAAWATLPLTDKSGLGGILGVTGTPAFAVISSGELVAAGWMHGDDWQEFVGGSSKVLQEKEGNHP